MNAAKMLRDALLGGGGIHTHWWQTLHSGSTRYAKVKMVLCLQSQHLGNFGKPALGPHPADIPHLKASRDKVPEGPEGLVAEQSSAGRTAQAPTPQRKGTGGVGAQGVSERENPQTGEGKAVARTYRGLFGLHSDRLSSRTMPKEKEMQSPWL